MVVVVGGTLKKPITEKVILPLEKKQSTFNVEEMVDELIHLKQRIEILERRHPLPPRIPIFTENFGNEEEFEERVERKIRRLEDEADQAKEEREKLKERLETA